MHNKLNGLTYPHVMYILPCVRLGVGNDLQLSDLHGFQGNERHSKLCATLFVQFLPYVGYHNKNPLY
jgi:hypothetical protein